MPRPLGLQTGPILSIPPIRGARFYAPPSHHVVNYSQPNQGGLPHPTHPN